MNKTITMILLILAFQAHAEPGDFANILGVYDMIVTTTADDCGYLPKRAIKFEWQKPLAQKPAGLRLSIYTDNQQPQIVLLKQTEKNFCPDPRTYGRTTQCEALDTSEMTYMDSFKNVADSGEFGAKFDHWEFLPDWVNGARNYDSIKVAHGTTEFYHLHYNTGWNDSRNLNGPLYEYACASYYIRRK
jgi:hypothetical protein